MPYTFGAATTDAITWTSLVNHGANGAATLFCGWFYPTTLTATRKLFCSGLVFGAEIDTTTSQIRFRTDNTTDGQFTAPAGFVLNQWIFVAALGAGGAAATSAWRCWTGTIDTAPVERTVTTATAPVGANTGSTVFALGNNSSSTLAFQGDMAEFGYFATTAAVGASTHPFQMVTAGTLAQAVADFVYPRYVLPFWAGHGWAGNGVTARNGILTTSTDEYVHLTLNTLPQARRIQSVNATALVGIEPTISGATVSTQTGHPRPLINQTPYQLYRRR